MILRRPPHRARSFCRTAPEVNRAVDPLRADGTTCPSTHARSPSAAATNGSADKNRRRREFETTEFPSISTAPLAGRRADTHTRFESSATARRCSLCLPSVVPKSELHYRIEFLKTLLLVVLIGISLGVSFSTCLAAEPPKYTGPGSCASPSCHGGVAPRSDNSVWQNEYSTWVVKDKHSQAFTALSLPIAVRMAKILELPNAFSAPKCLACHALDVPEAQRARTFDLADGVSCESCHGPASNWLGPHTTKGWTHQQSIEAGMYDDRDLISRSQKCLSCHLGTSEKFVDHQMIAAGHPDLYFELASFSSVMPKHWQEPRDREPTQDVWIEVRALAAGQAVQLSQQLRRVARNVQGPNWPEYSELDCFACHHSLTSAKDSWRQELGYANRRAGNPPWNLSRYVILRAIAADDRAGASQLPPEARGLSQEIERLYLLIGATSPDRSQI